MTNSNEPVTINPERQLGCNECNLTQKCKKPLTEKIQSTIISLEKSISKNEEKIQHYKDGIKELTAVLNSVEAGILPASVITVLDNLMD